MPHVDLVLRDGMEPALRGRILFRIQDILDAMEKVQRVTAGTSLEAFERDEKLIDAVVHNSTIIGEAANHVPSAITSREAAIPWRQMITRTGTCGLP